MFSIVSVYFVRVGVHKDVAHEMSEVTRGPPPVGDRFTGLLLTKLISV